MLSWIPRLASLGSSFLPSGLTLYATVFAVALALGGAGTWRIMEWRAEAHEAAHAQAVAEAEAKTIAAERKMTEISGHAEAALQTARANVQTITKTIVKKVPVYVRAQDDARCAIPRGFILLHDAAAAGRDLSSVPDPASGDDGGPSGVALSAVADTVAGNYGTYAEVVTQLRALQGWVKAQQAVAR